MIDPMFETPLLTRTRIRLSYAVAVTADALQLLLGPIGFAFADEAIDVATMVITTVLLGFHPLLLPTFVLEFLPMTDLLPTWTGCVALVIAHRKKQQSIPPPSQGPIIDV